MTFADVLVDWRSREDHQAALQLLLDKALLRYCGLWNERLERCAVVAAIEARGIAGCRVRS